MDSNYSVEYSDLTNQVFTVLRNKITAGEFRHGEALKLAQLTQKLGVSQTPVREALIRLAEKEYIEKNDSRSYIIKKITRQQYMQLSQLRANIEAHMIQQIIENDWVSDIEGLQKIYNEQCSAMESGDYEKGLVLNRDFHGFYLRWANIPQVAEFVENICVIAGPILRNLKDNRLTTIKDKHFHAQILLAFRDGNQEKAAEMVRDDVMVNAERTCAMMLD